MQPSPWSIIPFENGTRSLAHPDQGNEPMHSKIGPEQESLQVYFSQSPWQCPKTADHPILWDVGLGTAANVCVSLREINQRRLLKHIQIESFESDPSGLRAAITNQLLPEYGSFKAVFDSLLSQGEAEFSFSNHLRVRWKLHIGDFMKCFSLADAPSIIYYDFFSPKICPELWSQSTFEKIVSYTKQHLNRPPSTTLVTYCAASAVRKNLKQAGFQVEIGTGTNAKRETTIAQIIW